MMRPFWLLGSLLCVCTAVFAQSSALKPSQQGLVYGNAAPELKMDYYAGTGVGARPIAILIRAANAAENSLAAILVPGGYDVFSVSYRPAEQHPMQDVERAIRYVRFHAREWNGDARKIALVGVSGGGYLSTMVGLDNSSGVMGSDDSVDRESARVQAVVAVFGIGDASSSALNESLRAMLDPLLKQKSEEAELARSSDIYVNPDSPPFLLMDGGTLAQSTGLQDALRKVGMRCDLVRVPSENPGTAAAWEHDIAEWLNKTLGQQAPIGASIRQHTPKQG